MKPAGKDSREREAAKKMKSTGEGSRGSKVVKKGKATWEGSRGGGVVKKSKATGEGSRGSEVVKKSMAAGKGSRGSEVVKKSNVGGEGFRGREVGNKGKEIGKGFRGNKMGRGNGGRGSVEEDDDSDSDFEYESENEELDESDEEIDTGDESWDDDDMEGSDDDDMESGDDDSIEGGDDDDNMEGEDEMGNDEATKGRAARSVCYGHYKKPPKKGQPKLGVVEFIDEKTIKQPKYKRTLKAIMRAEWKYETAFERGRKRNAFLDKCVKKFRRYYYYPEDYTVEEGNAVVKEHLKRNLKQNMFIWKRDANEQVKEALENGKEADRLMFKPHYLEEDAWRGCCDYWDSTGHKKMSETNKENRTKLKFPHASGAKPFEERRLVSPVNS
nr:PREDICTED: nucleolin-like [Daucus carota subsp. sativus]